MFCCYLLEMCSFILADRKGVDQERMGGGEKLGEVKEGETNQGILCEKRVFSIKGKMKKEL